METQQKFRRFPTIFRTSFSSCSSRTFSDIIHKSVVDPLPRPFPSFRRTGPASYDYPPDPTAPFTLGDILKGRLCPASVAPAAPTRHSFHQNKTSGKKSETEFHDWFSSDDDEREEEEEEEKENEMETLFSSRNLSSDSSSRSFRCSSRRSRSTNRRPCVDVKDSFAVVKRSSDPYGDFRRSMVEMIVEKEMFRAEKLEQLLQCFLSLNDRHHHGVILEVFTEICEALLPHWS